MARPRDRFGDPLSPGEAAAGMFDDLEDDVPTGYDNVPDHPMYDDGEDPEDVYDY